MLEFLKRETNRTFTENGAPAHETTYSNCLDLFATIGALRRRDEDEIIERFKPAFREDADIALKTLFFSRDVRGGLGERRVFRTILRYLANENPVSVIKNIPFIAEYGRWDDILVLFGTLCEKEALECIKKRLEEDIKNLE